MTDEIRGRVVYLKIGREKCGHGCAIHLLVNTTHSYLTGSNPNYTVAVTKARASFAGAVVPLFVLLLYRCRRSMGSLYRGCAVAF